MALKTHTNTHTQKWPEPVRSKEAWLFNKRRRSWWCLSVLEYVKLVVESTTGCLSWDHWYDWSKSWLGLSFLSNFSADADQKADGGWGELMEHLSAREQYIALYKNDQWIKSHTQMFNYCADAAFLFGLVFFGIKNKVHAQYIMNINVHAQ